ncbi:MAG: hypothetical protein RR444_01350 [Oscillospiraceae bacterium]
MRVKLYRISLLIIAVIVIIASIVAFNYMNQSKKNSEKNILPTNDFMYVLKEHEQKIGVYKANETSPFMTIDVYVKTLPSVDQQELKSGIMIQNEDKLKTIIEDYES